jgi:hypothetical protein
MPPDNRPPRRDKLIQDQRHDPYRAKRLPPEPTVCPECGAVMRDGRWQWSGEPFGVPRSPCPACQRAADGYPAGYVTLTGPFERVNPDELVNLARNIETREQQEHALKRIIEIERSAAEIRITTTDTHLARAIGDAIHRSHGGRLEYKYAEDENLIRVLWEA